MYTIGRLELVLELKSVTTNSNVVGKTLAKELYSWAFIMTIHQPVLTLVRFISAEKEMPEEFLWRTLLAQISGIVERIQGDSYCKGDKGSWLLNPQKSVTPGQTVVLMEKSV